jgi:hypothetical protein
MLLQFLKIRFKQFYRFGLDLGILRSIFILIVFGVICVLLPKLVKESPYIIAFILLLIIISMHLQRKDGIFLKILNIKKSSLYFVEYLCLVLPVLLAYSLSKQYIWVDLVLLLFIFYISKTNNLKFKKKLKLSNVTLAPTLLFEYISGLRANFLPLAFMYLIAAALSFTVFAVPVFIILYTFTVCSFNTDCESRSFIEVFNLSAKSFIIKKIKLQLLFTLLIFSPLLLAYGIFNIHYWYIGLYACLICLISISFSIIYKYAIYKPGESLGGNNILNSFAVISFLIPFLIPIVPIMMIKYYNKALDNVKEYTYA